jgi:hypothetical protein
MSGEEIDAMKVWKGSEGESLMKDLRWKGRCEECEWEGGFMNHSDAEKDARQHDREEHAGERVAVLISSDGQVQG